MDTTAKKPRAKAINKNWATMDAIGWRWWDVTWRKRQRWPLSILCTPKHCASEYAHPAFVDSMNADMLAAHHNPVLKYARKGRRHDLAMAEEIYRNPEAHAAVEAAILAASTPTAAPTAKTMARL